MLLLFVFLQIQGLVLVVIAYVLRQYFRASVDETCNSNSIRIDGSYSQRRHNIELESIKHSTLTIFRGLATIFLLTAVVEVLFALVCCGLWGLGPIPDVGQSQVDPLANLALVTFINEWQWPLILGYTLLSIAVFPPYFLYLSRSALERYQRRAKGRFQQYCQREWAERQDEPHVEILSH